MGEERTSDLALLSIEGHFTEELYEDPDLVVDEFAKIGNRKLSFSL